MNYRLLQVTYVPTESLSYLCTSLTYFNLSNIGCFFPLFMFTVNNMVQSMKLHGEYHIQIMICVNIKVLHNLSTVHFCLKKYTFTEKCKIKKQNKPKAFLRQQIHFFKSLTQIFLLRIQVKTISHFDGLKQEWISAERTAVVVRCLVWVYIIN